MNKQVLDAIVTLLAQVSRLDGFNESEYEIVRKFLHEHLSDERAKEYLDIFTRLVEEEEEDSIAEAEKLCHELNKQMNLRQKLIVLLRLLEVVFADQSLTRLEEDFVSTVAKSFNIDDEKFNALKLFVGSKSPRGLAGESNVLLVDAEVANNLPGMRHLQKADLPFPLAVLRLAGADMYFLRPFEVNETIFLNSDSLRAGHIYAFSVGSVIKGEKMDPVYYSEVVSAFMKEGNEKKITFEARNINLFFQSGKQGLHNVNVREEGGRMVALMGGSGAGKSTLMNVLNGNITPQQGEVLINGINLHKEAQTLKGVIGYVPQDDLLMEDLTVSQNLLYAARLCFSENKESQNEELVNRTLKSLGLFEVRDLKVGNVLQKTISGGQRKRLNIGLELLREPSVMFMDEPTSGLSSRDSENILDLLRELSISGKLIFVVIHQPSSELFKMFDRLIILDVGGYQIYYGNPVEAVIYFKTLDDQINQEHGACELCGNVNPEQIFNIIEHKVVDEFGMPTAQRKTSPETWNKFFQKHIILPEVKTETGKPENSLSIPNKLKQFFIFTGRDLLSKANNKQYLAINLLQAPLLALLLSIILRYDKINELTAHEDYRFCENMNLPSFIFISVIISLFMGLVVSAEEIIRDVKMLKREAFLNLSRSSYLLSKVFIMFGFSLMQTCMYVLISTYVMGIEDMDLRYWIALFSCSCFANMLGLNVSTTFNSAITIYILIPILLIPQLVLGGIVVKFDEINPHFAKQGKVPFVGEIMAARWAFEAICVTQFMDNAYERELYPFERDLENADFKNTYFIPALRSKLNGCMSMLNGTEKLNTQIYVKDLAVLQAEISKENRWNKSIKFQGTDRLVSEKFNERIGKELEAYLDKLEHYNTQLSNTERKRKDNFVATHYNTDTLRAHNEHMRVSHHNERLADMVADRKTGVSIIEYKGKLIRNYKPIFFAPDNASGLLDFNAHFFAPCKYFLGRYWPTFGFNMCVIWSMTFVLYITLYFRTFRKLLRIKK
ncbi:MAG: ATP-binding cassette domain-containing protein [Bacteroidota bacterium]